MDEEIVLASGQTQAIIRPGEGALVSRFSVGGKDILFPAQIFQTPEGPKKRGGIPLLFPNADPLTENQSLFHLKQHGFARQKTWKTESAGRDSAVFSLSADEETRKEYPFDFRLELKVRVENSLLDYSFTIENPSPEKILPVAPGLHPYFAVPLEEKAKIKTNLSGFNPQKYDWNSPLSFPGQPTLSLQIPGLGQVNLKVSSEFKTWTVWSNADKNFVCFEPWAGPRNALLHEEQRINLPPGEKITLFLKMEVTLA